MCRKFGLMNSTVRRIWEDRTKLLMRLNGSRIKRFRKPERSDAVDVLLKLFQYDGSDSVRTSRQSSHDNFCSC